MANRPIYRGNSFSQYFGQNNCEAKELKKYSFVVYLIRDVVTKQMPTSVETQGLEVG